MFPSPIPYQVIVFYRTSTLWHRMILKLFCVLFNQGNIYGIFKNIMIRLVTLFNRQGKIRLQKWYESNSYKGQFKIYLVDLRSS